MINEKIEQIEMKKKEYMAQFLTKDKLPQLIKDYTKARELTRKFDYKIEVEGFDD